jgi:hypothetical protein
VRSVRGVYHSDGPPGVPLLAGVDPSRAEDDADYTVRRLTTDYFASRENSCTRGGGLPRGFQEVARKKDASAPPVFALPPRGLAGQAWKYTPASLLPIVFVLDPAGAGLLLKPPAVVSWTQVAWIVMTASAA